MRARRYQAIIALQWREALTYRVDLLADLLSAGIWLAIQYFLWRAVFEAQPTVAGLDFEFMVSYIALVRIVQGFVQSGTIEEELARRVKDGSIAVDLMRPYNLQVAAYLQVYSRALLNAIIISVPIFIVALFVFKLNAPDPLRVGLFIVSLHLGLAVNAGISFLVGLVAFPLKNNEGAIQVRRFFTTALSGNLFPIVLMPGVLRDFAELLPFRAIVDVPIGIYMGHLPWTCVGFQALWAAALGLLGHILFLKAQRRLVILGG